MKKFVLFVFATLIIFGAGSYFGSHIFFESPKALEESGTIIQTTEKITPLEDDRTEVVSLTEPKSGGHKAVKTGKVEIDFSNAFK